MTVQASIEASLKEDSRVSQTKTDGYKKASFHSPQHRPAPACSSPEGRFGPTPQAELSSFPHAGANTWDISAIRLPLKRSCRAVQALCQQTCHC